MNFKLVTVSEACELLRWGVTTFHTRRGAGLFPQPFKISGSKKGNLYFEHEIEKYIERAIFISTEEQFKALAQEIESSRINLAA